jgi:uncharacterized protein (DUF885 family)
MPGHYLEGAHSAQFPSTLRAVLRSGPFAEGWAVYTEKMMTDAGYLDGDPLFRLVQLTSAQLPTYFVGVQEHFDTRKAVEAKLGDAFDLKAYHDRILSYGAPPVRFARELMLDQPIE